MRGDPDVGVVASVEVEGRGYVRLLVVDPDGVVVAQARTLEDELVVADCDLDATLFGKQTVFDFARHRRIEHYGRIASQVGVTLPPEA